MLYILFTNFIAIFFAYCAKSKDKWFGLLFAFLVIWLFLSIRYDFGNDYMAYLEMHQEIEKGSIGDFNYELGWVFINKIIPNFFLLIVLLSSFNCLVYYNYIKSYVIHDYWWLAVFMYCFNTNFMLIQSSAMRQTVAILIFIISFKYIINRNCIAYMFCCVLAVFFHESALILFPIYWIVLIPYDKRWYRLLIIVFFLTIYFVANSLQSFVAKIVLLIFQSKYEHFLVESSQVSILNAVLYAILLVIILEFTYNKKFEIRAFAWISILALFTFPLSSIVPMTARLGYYFFPATMVTYTYIARIMPLKMHYLFVFLLILVILRRFEAIVYSDIWRDHFLIYKTIFNI